jgi:hypothetical protein
MKNAGFYLPYNRLKKIALVSIVFFFVHAVIISTLRLLNKAIDIRAGSKPRGATVLGKPP